LNKRKFGRLPSFYTEKLEKCIVLRPEQEVELIRLVRSFIELENIALDFQEENGFLPDYNQWAERAGCSPLPLIKKLFIGKQAKDRLIEANLRFVVKTASLYVKDGFPLEDLVQCGSIGLIKAVEKFDEKRGCKFSTHAWWWIMSSIKASIKAADPTSRQKKSTKSENCFQIHRVDSIEEIEDWESRVFTVEDENTEDDFWEPSEKHLKVRGIYSTLTEREKQILNWRLGLDGTGKKSLKETAEIIGITKEGVRIGEIRVLKKLKARLSETQG
jgi:RNA polymerase sigma factor (sigma-70 family)